MNMPVDATAAVAITNSGMIAAAVPQYATRLTPIARNWRFQSGRSSPNTSAMASLSRSILLLFAVCSAALAVAVLVILVTRMVMVIAPVRLMKWRVNAGMPAVTGHSAVHFVASDTMSSVQSVSQILSCRRPYARLRACSMRSQRSSSSKYRSLLATMSDRTMKLIATQTTTAVATRMMRDMTTSIQKHKGNKSGLAECEPAEAPVGD